MVRTGSLSIKHGKQQQQKQLTDSTMLYLNESIFNRHLRGEHFSYGQPRKILHDHPMQPPSQQIHISIRVSANSSRKTDRFQTKKITSLAQTEFRADHRSNSNVNVRWCKRLSEACWHGAEEALQLLRFRRRLPRLRSDLGGRAVEAFCQDDASEGVVVGDSLLGAVGSAGSFSRVRMVASKSERCWGVSCWIMCTAESIITSGLT